MSADRTGEYRFRDIHPLLKIGTCSDRYAGWTGQIYTPGKYKTQKRRKTVGGKQYTEQVLPVESVKEYFEHFQTLEIDFTFYRPLLDIKTGEPTNSYYTLKRYLEYINEGDSLILKAPQITTARKLFRNGKFVDNSDYLNPDIFMKGFLKPVLELADGNIEGLIFEQEYRRKNELSKEDALHLELERFLDSLPPDKRYTFEIRTPSLLTPDLIRTLEGKNSGTVISRWTWLPRPNEQYELIMNNRESAPASLFIRLLTPFGMDYKKTYAAAYPFDKLVEGMLSDETVEDLAKIISGSLKRKIRVYLLINNRAGGNAPDTANIIKKRLLEAGVLK